MEYVSIRDTKEVENTNNKNLSAVIAENRQDKEVNDLKKYSNTAVEAQTELEDRNVIDTEEGITNEPIDINN